MVCLVEPQHGERPVFGDLGVDAKLGEKVESVEGVATVFEQRQEVRPGTIGATDKPLPQVSFDYE